LLSEEKEVERGDKAAQGTGMNAYTEPLPLPRRSVCHQCGRGKSSVSEGEKKMLVSVPKNNQLDNAQDR